MVTINLTYRDSEVIFMALIDNATLGRLNRIEYKMAWNILENCLDKPTKLSKDELTLICNSLRRYANKYVHERLEVAKCNKVYNKILEAYKHG